MDRKPGKNLFFIGVLAALALTLGIAPRAFAQSSSGSIVGTIRDQQGAVIPNAAISAKNLGTGAERSAMSDASGGFSIVSVPAGAYSVTATAPGFQTEIRSSATVTVGAALRVDFTLNVGAVSEKVEVTGEAPQVDTTTSTMSGLVNDTTIRELPLNGRDWLQLAQLQAGVQRVETQDQGLGRGPSRGTGASQNVYLVDGLVVNEQTNNSPGSILGSNMGVDAIREFSVLTNTFPAQYGRSAGGVINAITKSGTNDLHGTAFYFGRNSALDARNFFDLKTSPTDPHRLPPFRRHQFGGSAGGPIKKNKLFYFANYEGLRQFLSQSFSNQTLSPNARNGILATGTFTIDPRVQAYLPLFPLPNGPITGNTGLFVFGAGQQGTENYVTGRVDYLLSPNTTLSGSYAFDNASSTTPDAYNEKFLANHTRNQRVIVNLQHIFSSTVLNTVRTGFTRTVAFANQDTSPLTPLLTNTSLGFVAGRNMGSFNIPEIKSSPGGIGADGADLYWYTDPQFDDDLSWVKGRNSFKMGFSFEAIRDNVNFQSNPNGQWQFGSIQDFFTVTPQQFNSDFPGTSGYEGLRSKLFGVYFQDDLRLRSNLTLNLGLRWEPATDMIVVNNQNAALRNVTDTQVTIGNPVYNSPSMRNIAPRVGFAWDPFGDGKTSVRAGFGVLDLPQVPNMLNGKVTRSAPFFENGILNNPPSSSFPNGIFSLLGPTSLGTVVTQMNPSVAYKMQWNLNIQRQITRTFSLTAGYVGSKGVHLPLQRGDIDQVPPSLVTTLPGGKLQFPTTGTIPKINPNWARIMGSFWDGYSVYHSLQVNAVQQFSHGLMLQAAYVWSKSIDIGSQELGTSELPNSIEVPWSYNMNLNRAVSDFDIPQHLSLNFLYDLPLAAKSMSAVPRTIISGWELGGIFTVQSGTPYSVSYPFDRTRTGATGLGQSNAAQRPDFNPTAPGCTNGGVNPGNFQAYTNLACFSLPALGQIGTLGRNAERGPGLEDFDFSIFKSGNIGERVKYQFRAEFFNILNRANLEATLVPAFNTQGVLIPANAALKPPTVTTSRQIQYGLKFIW